MSKPSVKKFFKSIQTKAKQYSPEILTGVGIAGMITTTVLAVKATPKAMRLIDEYKETVLLENEEITPIDAVKVAWKPYAPALTTCVFSTACLIGANSVNARRNAALATAYKLSETAFSEYKAKVIETIGDKKEQVVRDQVAKDKVEKNPVSNNEVIITEKGNTLCYDSISGRYFKSDIDKIRKAENNINHMLLVGDYVSLNEFYNELGLDNTKLGDDLGWNIIDGLIEIQFSSQIADDGTPCIVIDYAIAPNRDYNRYA